MIKFSTTLLVSASFLSLASPALAQSTGADEGADSGEIIVTAQRRAESVQDVPISVTVVSGTQLDQQRINNISDLARVSSALQLHQTPATTGGGAYIRGIGTYSRGRSAEPSVGFVVDGVVQGLTNTRNLDDIERLEVLRGPQGTLFGQSVSAGVVNITTKAPNYNDFSGKVSVQVSDDGTLGSEYGRQLGRLSLNIPIAGKAGVRVSGYLGETQGVIENAFDGRKDRLREWGVRGRFKTDIGDLSVDAIAEYAYNASDRGGGFPTVWRVIRNTTTSAAGVSPATVVTTDLTNNTTASRSAAIYAACGLTPSIENMENCSDGNSLNKFVTQGYSLQLNYDGGDVSLTSITAYRKLDSDTGSDIDNVMSALGSTEQQSGGITNYTQFTQEFRAATDPNRPVSLTLGGFYLRSTVYARGGSLAGAFGRDYNFRGSNPIATCWPVQTDARCATFTLRAQTNGQDYTSDNLSGFGEVRYQRDGFTAFAGLRVSSSKTHLDGFQNALTSDLSYSDTHVMWRAGATYDVAQDTMLYGTVATGYKAAQIAPIQNNRPAQVVFPEKPTTYEVGIKTSLFDRKLNLNLAGFYSKIDGYQTTFCVMDAIAFTPTCNPQNIDGITSKGFEFDLFGRLSPNWTINANATYNVVKYPTGYLADDGSSLAGQQLMLAPRFAATIGTDYSVPLGDKLEGFISLDMNYLSKMRLGTGGGSQDYVYKAHAVFGGRIGVRVDKSWSLAVFADNIGSTNDPSNLAGISAQIPDGRAGAGAGLLVESVVQSNRSIRQVGIQASLQF
ncbi:MAG: hypothetical protein B7X90_02175 [Novosphingobium sp. 17-62-19]|uniref:TonB-dependent receptor n=1 Tax=Novosphingobium sp. 17-62-19 TaxID=1970406 RepID=UPI000BD81624|nr:TonB-dependent receptor [Novosphingobium sp. 17-62-19]OZA21438.1 MAG: hypothetical protein B7X90_02175 [Novosphingobium sp. 17-62-19]HQS96090.1 TonB-dependent receptor [Novosphingobium sp.]